jgi:predicted aspartyl protease
MLKAALLAGVLSLAVPLAAAPMEVLPSGHPIAEVSLDGSKPLRFVIDTAATSTSVLPKLRAAMPGSMKVAGSQNLSGAGGQTQIETLTLGRLAVDGRMFEGLKAFALPPSPVDALGVDGVLGTDVIARYVLEMDMPGRSWRMVDRTTPEMLRGMHAPVPFKLDEGLTPLLGVTINGVFIPAVLDTGAKGTIINWAAARLLGITPETPGLKRASALKGVTSQALDSVIHRVDALQIGDFRQLNFDVRIADLPVFNVLGFQNGAPAMILGIDALANRRFIIDHPARTLHIARVEETGHNRIDTIRPRPMRTHDEPKG